MIESTVNIKLKEDFYILCSIYQIKPEVFLQSFIDQISFPCFYSHPLGKNNRLATLYFLNFLNVGESNHQVNEDLESHYLLLFHEAVGYNHEYSPDDKAESINFGRGILRQWEKAELAERAKYITDNL